MSTEKRLAEITRLLRDLARESIDGRNVPRGEYIAFQLRLGDALDEADAALAAYQEAASCRAKGETRADYCRANAFFDDLGELCRVVGELDAARPESPQVVFRTCISHVKGLKQERDNLRQTLELIRLRADERLGGYACGVAEGDHRLLAALGQIADEGISGFAKEKIARDALAERLAAYQEAAK